MIQFRRYINPGLKEIKSNLSIMIIWLISLFEPTPVDNTRPMRYMSIAEAALKKGHSVVFFSNTFRHSTKKQRFPENHLIEIKENYRLQFIYSSPYLNNVSIKRLYSHNVFNSNFKKIIDDYPQPDVILVAFPTIGIASFVTSWAEKRSIKVFIDIIDPWPNINVSLMPKILLPFFKVYESIMAQVVKKILFRTSGAISISNEYIQWAKKLNPSLTRTSVYLPSVPFNEVQEKINSFKKNLDLGHRKLRVVYAGNLGLAYDIPTIISASEILEKKYPGKVEFYFAGAGYYEEHIRSATQSNTSIFYLGRLGYDELLNLYSKCDLGLCQYSSNATQSITYKFFDYLGSGLPILNSLMTEMAVLTEKMKVGLNNNPGDFNQLALNISEFLNNSRLLEEYKINAVKFSSTEGNNEIVYEKLINFITQ